MVNKKYPANSWQYFWTNGLTFDAREPLRLPDGEWSSDGLVSKPHKELISLPLRDSLWDVYTIQERNYSGPMANISPTALAGGSMGKGI